MERMADEKVNLTFIDSFFTFPLLFDFLLLIYISTFPEEPSAPLLCFGACLRLSCACSIYESVAGSSVSFLSDWRFVHFRTRLTGEGWHAASCNLLWVSCCDLFAVQGGGVKVQACAVQGP